VNLKDQLVTHCKVHVLDLAFVEICGTEGYIIDLGIVETAVVECTVDKRNPYKSSFRKITLFENAPLKIGVVQHVMRVGEVGKDFL